MSTFAILPIKALDHAKGRLAGGLGAGPRRALVQAMLADVLVGLRRSDGVKRIVVVSADRVVGRIAAGYGAEVRRDEGAGHSAAASLGASHAAAAGADRVLMVPGDCPLLCPAEIDALLGDAQRTPSAVIVPDRHGSGTNALLLAPPAAITPAFGPNSRERHAGIAAAAGVAHEIRAVPSLALDVDTPEDLHALREAFAASRGGAAHTRGLLGQLDRAGPG